MQSFRAPMPDTVGLIPVAGLHVLADRYDVLLCDLWGVMHDGRRSFPGAIEALQRFRGKGGTVVFITNAPRPRDPVLAQIAGLGIPDDAFDGLVTSGDVTVAAIAAAGAQGIYHIGPDRDHALFDVVRRRTGASPPLVALDDADLVVVTGLFDDRTETPADYVPQLDHMRARGLPMICANPDIVVHVGEQLIYCGGAIAEAYRERGGHTVLAGKPHAPIYEAALALAAERRGVPVSLARVLAIGDGMVTDGAGAAAQSLDFLFVSSGIHRDELHPDLTCPLDAERYAEQVLALAHPPLAAMQHLAW